MSDVAIRVESLSKRYRIGERERYYALRDVLANAFKAPFRLFKPLPPTYIWALNGVSFEVKQGEVIGIIGRNGAGKTTLLKILSRITRPTAGYAEIHGRVGSLLEVGTGFHPELTGRENVYLNGAILGMKKEEIKHRFDEIVAFAEIEKFIDTPVKHYSSGMYVRLAFAVAAHLEPKILMVDEVLAVGDATYQRRCIDRMSTLASTGRTILFVSHNMDLIPRLCGKVILLEGGQVLKEGRAPGIVEEYLARQLNDREMDDLACRPRPTGDGRARFVRLQLVDSSGTARPTHISGEDVVLRMDILSEYDIPDVALAVSLKTLSGTPIISSWTREVDFPVSLQKGLQRYQCHFKRVTLRPGHSIGVDLWMDAHGVIDYIENAGIIQITGGTDTCRLSTDRYQGVVVCENNWSRLTGEA